MSLKHGARLFVLTMIFVGGLLSSSWVRAQAPANLNAELTALNELLAIDRLDFYSDGLADSIQETRPELAALIRRVQPEDFMAQNYTSAQMLDHDHWNEMVLQTVKVKFPKESVKYTAADVQWNYAFFRRKLLECFRADSVNIRPEPGIVPYHPERVQFEERPVPAPDGSRILLDADRYISEKTTRGLFWDASRTGKGIEFHVGTERDFRVRMAIEKRQVVAEVKTRASNYNKIYLIYDPTTQKYSYAFTRISGDDRVVHLLEQLRIIRFENNLPVAQNKVRVYGNTQEAHQLLESSLTDLFKTLPKADLVVIGQKAAITNVIGTAGMMLQMQPNINVALTGSDLTWASLREAKILSRQS